MTVTSLFTDGAGNTSFLTLKNGTQGQGQPPQQAPGLPRETPTGVAWSTRAKGCRIGLLHAMTSAGPSCHYG